MKLSQIKQVKKAYYNSHKKKSLEIYKLKFNNYKIRSKYKKNKTLKKKNLFRMSIKNVLKKKIIKLR